MGKFAGQFFQKPNALLWRHCAASDTSPSVGNMTNEHCQRVQARACSQIPYSPPRNDESFLLIKEVKIDS
jgi:hypothetical protein